MTWSLHVSGHEDDRTAEDQVVEVLRAAVREVGATWARFGGTWHGQLDLLEDPQ